MIAQGHLNLHALLEVLLFGAHKGGGKVEHEAQNECMSLDDELACKPQHPWTLKSV